MFQSSDSGFFVGKCSLFFGKAADGYGRFWKGFLFFWLAGGEGKKRRKGEGEGIFKTEKNIYILTKTYNKMYNYIKIPGKSKSIDYPYLKEVNTS